MPIRHVRFAARAWGSAAVASILAVTACSQPADAKPDPKAKGAASSTGASAAPRAPAAPVKVAVVQAKDTRVELRGIGSVQASASATIRSQTSGILTRVSFTEGADVAQDEILMSIDPRPWELALEQAQANAAKSRAGTAQAQANAARDQAQAENADLQARRYAGLLGQGVTTQEQVEQLRTAAAAARAAVDADLAAVESGKAAIAADEAAVANARVQLGYCTIRAPFAGRAGILLLNQGNLVTAGATPLVTINRLSPIYVLFSVPESALGAVRSHQKQGNLPVRATPSSSGGDWSASGTVDFIDNQVDQTTGTIQLRAVFANADGGMWPGEFVQVVVDLAAQPGSIVVPSQALQTGQKGDYVFVVTSGQTAEMRPVTVDRAIDGETVIAKGLAPGETVIIDGLLRVAPGGPVQVATSDAPQAAGGAARDDRTDGARAPGGGRAPAGDGKPAGK